MTEASTKMHPMWQVDPLYAEWKEPYEVAILEAHRETGAVYQHKAAHDAFLHAVWLAFRRNPPLQKATAESIRAAVVTLALSGLDITQPGEVWLIPMDLEQKNKDGNKTGRKATECVVWDGYIGRLKLVRQQPDVLDADCREVREGDTYKYRGFHDLPLHEDPENFGGRGGILGVYAYVVFRNGHAKCLQMSLADILAHRDQYARAGRSQFWQEKINGKENRGFQHMAKKVVSNQLCHPRHLTMTRTAAQIIERQEQVLADLRPMTGEDMQPKAPVAITGTAEGDLFPDARTPRHEALLADIRAEFGEHVVHLPGRARPFLAQACFSVEDWKALPTLPLADLEDGNRRWKRLLTALKTDALPEEHATWVDSQWFDWFMEHCHVGQAPPRPAARAPVDQPEAPAAAARTLPQFHADETAEDAAPEPEEGQLL